MPAPGEVTAIAASGPLDPRLLPWAPSHVAAADLCASAIQQALSSLDIVLDVDLCGSYALRTAINAAEEADHASMVATTPIVYPVDLMVTLTQDFCSMDDVDSGKYLQIRDRAVADIADCIAEAQMVDVTNAKKQVVARLVASAVTPVRATPLLSASKHAFVARFQHTDLDGLRPVFVDVIVHTRPEKVGAKVSAAKSIAKQPFYCNLVLEDHYALQHVQHAHAAVTANPELARATVSAKLWARHFGLLMAPAGRLPKQGNHHQLQQHAALPLNAADDEGISGFVLTSMLVDIATSAVNAASSTADGLLRQLWVHLSSARGLQHAVEGSHMNLLHVAAAVLDPSRELSIKRAAMEALSAQKGLQGMLASARPTHVCERYDVTMVLHCDDGAFVADKKTATAANGDDDDDTKAAPAPYPTYPHGREIAFAVSRTLAKAFGSRLSTFRVTSSANASRLVLLASFATEAEGRARLLRGPPIEDREAVAAFDSLWGASLTSSRQFNDGGVFRCVLWPSMLPPETTAVFASAETSDHRLAPTLLSSMVRHLVGKHHTTSGQAHANVTAADVADVLTEPAALGAAWIDTTGTAGAAVRSVIEKVTQLVKQSATESLPCNITQVSPVSAAARDTEVYPVLPHLSLLPLTPEAQRTTQTTDLVGRGWVSSDVSIDALNVVAVIDDKRKIPDTIDAIAVMKGAITAQIAKTIAGLGKGSLRVLCSKTWIDVLVDGFVVRVHIAHFREISLLRALDREAEADALERRLFHSHLHHVFIRSVIAQFPCAAGAMRLAKRWIGAMLMTDYILPEAVELLVANVYHSDVPPRTAHSGFLRFLRLLSNSARFSSEPIVVTGDAKETTTAVAAYCKARVDNPEQGLFIAAPYCVAASPYTANTPRAAMVERLASCAATSLAAFAAVVDVISAGHDRSASTIQSLFGWVDCRSFDAVLPFTNRIRGATAGRRRQLHLTTGQSTLALGTTLWTASPQTTEAELSKALSGMIERDAAAAAVRLMRGACREDALFFYDVFAPTAVGVAMLRKRKQPLPVEWTQAPPVAVCTLPPPTADGETVVPPSIFEVAGVIRKAVEAAAGFVVAPPLLRPPRKETADASPKQGAGKKQRNEKRPARDHDDDADADENGATESAAVRPPSSSTDAGKGRRDAAPAREAQPKRPQPRAEATTPRSGASKAAPAAAPAASSAKKAGGKPKPVATA